jgi:ABC-type Fe3+-hydroxamate transport system substrate-binding protein
VTRFIFLIIFGVALVSVSSYAQDNGRVITLSPHLAELVHDAGAGNKLVGVIRGSNYPARVLKIPAVGDASAIDIELIVKLKPDYIFAWEGGNRFGDIQKLQTMGFHVKLFSTSSIYDLPNQIREIGTLLGTSELALVKAKQLENELLDLRDLYRGDMVKRVFLRIWNRPIFTVGGESAINDILQICHARNVFQAYPFLAGPVVTEDILLSEIDLTVNFYPVSDESIFLEQFLKMGHRRVINYDPDILTRSTARTILEISNFCKLIRS